MGLYAVFLKDGDCGDIRYGRRYYDYQDGTVVFLAPGQVVGGDNGDEEFNPQGRAIMFHPDLLYGTHLGKHIGEYTFLSYQTNEALHISEEEKAIFIDCLEKTKSELRRSVDRHTNMIIASAIELLLNYCSRFYDRQFITRVKKNSDVLTRFESLLHDYFERGDAREQGLPSVRYCADRLYMSPNYFGDLIKKETGKSAQEYIQSVIIAKAKSLLSDPEMKIGEIGYELGFLHPSHFTRFFKKAVGCTPNEYRLRAS